MKYILPITISCLVALGACSDHDNTPIEPIKEKTFDASSGLTLYYNDEVMPSKSVTISQNGDQGTAHIFSAFELSQLSGLGMTGSIPGPGAIPGSPETTLSFKMSQVGDSWNFSGSSETDYCTFSYSGFANNDRLDLYLKNVKLKTGGITPSVWKPAPIKKEDGKYTSLPFYIDWQYMPLENVDFDLSPFIEALATLPIIPVYDNTAYMSLSQALSEVVKSVAFRPDGDIIISYVNTAFGAAQLAQTPANRYQYVIVSPQLVKLFIDPTSLLGMLLVQTSGGTPADEVTIIGNGMYPSGVESTSKPGFLGNLMASEMGSKIIKICLTEMAPMISQGIPFAVNASEKTLDLYIDTQMAATLIQKIVLPLLEDSKTVESIKEYLSSIPEFAPLLPDLEKAFQALPEALAKTTEFRLGFAFIPY